MVPDSFSLESPPQASSFSWFWKLLGAESPKPKTTPLVIPKYPTKKEDINLAVALQYGTAQGIPQLQKFIKEFSGKVYQPAYADWTILVHTGNTDGWSRVFQTLCNPGELFFTEEWTYPSALASSRPFGIKPVAVAMGTEGMRSDDLRKILSEWDEKTRGAARYFRHYALFEPHLILFSPHVMYTIPVGQNPSGAVSAPQGIRRTF